MKRTLLNLAALLSTILVVATAVMWLRSYMHLDYLTLPTTSYQFGTVAHRVRLASTRGLLAIDAMRIEVSAEQALRTPGYSYLVPFVPSDFDVTFLGLGVDHSDYGYPGLAPFKRHTVVALPYWFVATLFAILPTVTLARGRRQRRLPEHACAKCGYDLQGTLAAERDKCPECGTAVNTTHQPRP